VNANNNFSFTKTVTIPGNAVLGVAEIRASGGIGAALPEGFRVTGLARTGLPSTGVALIAFVFLASGIVARRYQKWRDPITPDSES
jgi:hypothetical protein